MEKKTVETITKVMFLTGVVLLSLNVAGLFASLRNPELQNDPDVAFAGDIGLSLDELEREIIRTPGESDEDFARRMTRAVNQGIAHYWLEQGIGKYNLRVPVWENYILYLHSLTDPQRFGMYEFIDHRKAMERGVGLCSQQAMVLKGILDDNGIETNILPLKGHVVARVRVAEDRWIVADPDYGVIIPHDIGEIMETPELVRQYYMDNLGNYRTVAGEELTDIPETMVGIYGPDGNYVLPDLKTYKGFYLHFLEGFSYIAIWILPLVLILPFAATTLGRRSQ